MALMRQLQMEPINLDYCLEAFTKEEQLGEEEKYYCSKCKQHQLASKKLEIWRLPPILVGTWYFVLIFFSSLPPKVGIWVATQSL